MGVINIILIICRIWDGINDPIMGWIIEKFHFKWGKYKPSRKLVGLVSDFCTINEPNIYAINCFLYGEWLNEEKSFATCMKVLRNMTKSHIEAYKIIHNLIPESRVGIALNMNNFIPKRKNNLIDKIATWFMDRCFNKMMAYSMGAN